MIELNNSLLVGEGNERRCYIHPADPSKLIKVMKSKSTKQQNKIDFVYYNYLKKENVDLFSVSKCYEWISTSLGKGLIFERVVNYDDSPANTFKEVILQGLLSAEQQQQLMGQLQQYLESNNIMFIDVSLSNVMCKKLDATQWQLVIIDGLGARRLGAKFWLQRNIKTYSKHKIKKQWKVFQENYYKLHAEIKAETKNSFA